MEITHIFEATNPIIVRSLALKKLHTLKPLHVKIFCPKSALYVSF